MKEYAAALKYITEVIERGIKDHPGKITEEVPFTTELIIKNSIFLVII